VDCYLFAKQSLRANQVFELQLLIWHEVGKFFYKGIGDRILRLDEHLTEEMVQLGVDSFDPQLIFKTNEPSTEVADIVSVHLDHKLFGLFLFVVKSNHRFEQIQADAVRSG